MARRIHRARFDLWPTEKIHGLVGKLNRLRFEDDISEAQDWLWQVLVDELEWRHHNPKKHAFIRCSCIFCLPPFPRDVQRPDPLMEASWAALVSTLAPELQSWGWFEVSNVPTAVR